MCRGLDLIGFIDFCLQKLLLLLINLMTTMFPSKAHLLLEEPIVLLLLISQLS